MTFTNTSTEQTAEIFKALGHPLRLQITQGLMKKDNCNVSKMVENLGVAQPKISQHISILKNAGIIEGYRKGNIICYKLVNEQVRAVIHSLGD